MSEAGFSSGCSVPVSPSRRPIAHAPRCKKAFLVPIDTDLARNRASVVQRLAGEGGELSGGDSSESSRNSINQRFPPRYSCTKNVPKSFSFIIFPYLFLATLTYLTLSSNHMRNAELSWSRCVSKIKVKGEKEKKGMRKFNSRYIIWEIHI